MYIDDDGDEQVGMVTGIALDEEMKEACVYMRKYTSLPAYHASGPPNIVMTEVEESLSFQDLDERLLRPNVV